MSEFRSDVDPRALYDERLSLLCEQIGELPAGSLLAEDLDMLEEEGRQFSEGKKQAEYVASSLMTVYWTHYMQLEDEARSNLNSLGFDFGRIAGVPDDSLGMHWNCAYEIKDYDYLRSDVDSSRMAELGKIASR